MSQAAKNPKGFAIGLVPLGNCAMRLLEEPTQSLMLLLLLPLQLQVLHRVSKMTATGGTHEQPVMVWLSSL